MLLALILGFLFVAGLAFLGWRRLASCKDLRLTRTHLSENIYSEHGRGIYLINLLMDEVRFERDGTEIHMRKG